MERGCREAWLPVVGQGAMALLRSNADLHTVTIMDFSPTVVIAAKRDGGALSRRQIAEFIAGYAAGRIADYQMAALAMAIYLQGMNSEETAALTEAMLDSGDTLAWPGDAPPIVDKHSTGGVGDKVSLVLAPLLACCGVWVPMISGRGLGPTGGTLDKLESIPGLRVDLTNEEIQTTVAQVGCVIAGASARIAPADRKLYALRDVTATVASIPLITASIMSKKLSEGLSGLVLDVKFGSGSFMKTMEQARALAASLADTGRRMGVATSAQLTNMDQPLGRMIGNRAEVDEAIATLQGEGPDDLVALTTSLGADLLVAVGAAPSLQQAATMLEDHLAAGRGWEKFEQMIAAQGGDLDVRIPLAPATEVLASRSGFVDRIQTEQLGQAVIELGGGRKLITDKIDHRVGLEMLVKIGDPVDRGQPLVRVFADDGRAAHVRPRIEASILVSDNRPARPALIAERTGMT